MAPVKRLLIAVTFASLIFVCLAPTVRVSAFSGGEVCPGGVAPWTGTIVGAGQVEQASTQDPQCATPQVTTTTGSTGHAVTQPPQQSLQDGASCSEALNADEHLGPVAAAKRSLSWWDPNRGGGAGAVATAEIDDQPFGPGSFNFVAPAGSGVPSIFASAVMGNGVLTVHWFLSGRWSAATQQCQGTWTVPADAPFCTGAGTCDPAVHVAAFTPTGNLPTPSAPPPIVDGVVNTVKQHLAATYVGGQVTSQAIAQGLVVQYPECFQVSNASLPQQVAFSVKVPQPGTGRVLVVNYVVSAVVDQVWWDFGEPENPTTVQQGVDPSTSCSVQHTYRHVSADAYGSATAHHPPPGEKWSWGDVAPAADEEAVASWQHVHFSVIGYYQQPDGTQYAIPLPVNGADDVWIASQPEWVRVNQIEGIPFTPTQSPSSG
jgi:hypothetical protein